MGSFYFQKNPTPPLETVNYLVIWLLNQSINQSINHLSPYLGINAYISWFQIRSFKDLPPSFRLFHFLPLEIWDSSVYWPLTEQTITQENKSCNP